MEGDGKHPPPPPCATPAKKPSANRVNQNNRSIVVIIGFKQYAFVQNNMQNLGDESHHMILMTSKNKTRLAHDTLLPKNNMSYVIK